jgi:hypothetical protein
MAKNAKTLCPILKQECIEDGAIINGELVACKFWMEVLGTNPQTGSDVKEGNCSINIIPMLLIENSKVSRETGAAVESFRNETVKANEITQKILLTTAGKPANNLIEVKDEINNN